jgi:hypothetical protein
MSFYTCDSDYVFIIGPNAIARDDKFELFVDMLTSTREVLRHARKAVFNSSKISIKNPDRVNAELLSLYGNASILLHFFLESIEPENYSVTLSPQFACQFVSLLDDYLTSMAYFAELDNRMSGRPSLLARLAVAGGLSSVAVEDIISVLDSLNDSELSILSNVFNVQLIEEDEEDDEDEGRDAIDRIWDESEDEEDNEEVDRIFDEGVDRRRSALRSRVVTDDDEDDEDDVDDEDDDEDDEDDDDEETVN